MPTASSPSTSPPRSRNTRRITGIASKRTSPTQGKREIVGSGWVMATYGSFVVNARPDRYFYAPGQPRGDHRGGARLRQQAGAHARSRRTVPLELAAARRPSEATGLRAADVDTGADGSGAAQRRHSAAGRLLPRARDRAHAGRPRRGAVHLPVGLGRRESDFGEGNRKTVQIIPDKKSYRAGDTAKLLIVTGQAEYAGVGHHRRAATCAVQADPFGGFHRRVRHPGHRGGRARHQRLRAVRAQRRPVPGREVPQGAAGGAPAEREARDR